MSPHHIEGTFRFAEVVSIFTTLDAAGRPVLPREPSPEPPVPFRYRVELGEVHIELHCTGCSVLSRVSWEGGKDELEIKEALRLPERFEELRDATRSPRGSTYRDAFEGWARYCGTVDALARPAIEGARRFLALVRDVVPRLSVPRHLHAPPSFRWSADGKSWQSIRNDVVDRQWGMERVDLPRLGSGPEPLADDEVAWLKTLIKEGQRGYAPLAYLRVALEASSPGLRVLASGIGAELAARDVLRRHKPYYRNDVPFKKAKLEELFTDYLRKDFGVPSPISREELASLRTRRNCAAHWPDQAGRITAAEADGLFRCTLTALDHLFGLYPPTKCLGRAVNEIRRGGFPIRSPIRSTDQDSYWSWWVDDPRVTQPDWFADLLPSSRFKERLQAALPPGFSVEDAERVDEAELPGWSDGWVWFGEVVLNPDVTGYEGPEALEKLELAEEDLEDECYCVDLIGQLREAALRRLGSE